MISLRNIHKYYYSDTSVAVGVRKINLEFNKGEFVAITGESGSGKSTLLNVISGMDTYEEGEMYIDGEPTSHFDDIDLEDYRRKRIGFIYQSYNLIESYTVLENIESVLLLCQDTFGHMTKKERKAYCMQYLEKVGLKKQARQRASHLSSGQRQRLSIARALAKNTDIIIADEPTGNLDSENGKQIIELLHDLSKEKLVVMVTHNYEQAAPYVTRKIRLYGGEVAEDILVNTQAAAPIPNANTPEENKSKINKSEANTSEEDHKPQEETYTSQSTKNPKTKNIKAANNKTAPTWAVAWSFVCKNRKAQPHRNFLIFSFMFLSVFASMIFLGNFLANLDDTSTRVINREAFYNIDKNRLVIRKDEGSEMTLQDVDKVMNLEHVSEVDLYDGVNDVNFFYKENEDYKLNYKTADEDLINSIEPEFLEYSKFMRSASSLKESDLKAGKLPEDTYDIVLYSRDESLVGREITFYFKNTRYWKDSTSVCLTMKVSGILKKKTEQVYFSTDLCRAFNVHYIDYFIKAVYERIKEVNYTDDSHKNTVSNSQRDFQAVLIPNAELKEKQMKISQNYFLNVFSGTKEYANYTQKEYIGSEATITTENSAGEVKTIDMELRKEGHLSTDYVVEVSYEMFEELYPDNVTMQMGVFIDDYVHADEVINSLNEAGYEAISVFRISAAEYDGDKVTQRLVTLAICSGAMVVIFFLDILVIYVLMKLKRRDFMILKSLGMRQKVIVKMNILDLTTFMLLSQLITICLAYVLSWKQVSYISNFLQYYHIINWLFLWIVGFCMSIIAAYVFNRHLKKRMATSSGEV